MTIHAEDKELEAIVARAVERAMDPWEPKFSQLQDSTVRLAERITSDG